MIVLSPQVQAQTALSCKAALNSADVVIAAQDKLNLALSSRAESLRSENDQLSASLVKMKDQADHTVGTTAVWTFGAFGAGLLTAIVLSSKH